MADKPSQLLQTLQQLTQDGKLSADTLLPMIMATLIDLRMQMDELMVQQNAHETIPSLITNLTSELTVLKVWKAESEKERAKLAGIIIGVGLGGGAAGGGIVMVIVKALGG